MARTRKPRKARRPKPPDGECISLWWEYGAEHEVVYGHVTPEVFMEAFHKECGARFLTPSPEAFVPRWGRWSCDDWAKSMGCDVRLVLYDEPGRGRFKLTYVDAKHFARDEVAMEAIAAATIAAYATHERHPAPCP